MIEHITRASELAKQAVENNWNNEEKMFRLGLLMNEFNLDGSGQLSGEIAGAFTQALVAAIKESK